MSNARIHFIGTVHQDPLGSERLQKALELEKPDIITVECSNVMVDYLVSEGLPTVFQKIDSLDFSQIEAGRLKKKFQDSNFEIFVSSEYALQNDLPIQYVDSPSMVNGTKKDVSTIESFSEYDFRKCFSLSLSRAIIRTDSIYSLYQKLFDGSAENEQWQLEPEAHKFNHRDAFMARNIERFIEPGAKLVHVGGIGHCLNDTKGRTLFSKLQQYNPTRATLKWYEDK